MSDVREISSPTNPLIKEIRALHMRKSRIETGRFLAEGARTIREALDNGTVPELIVYRADQRDEPAVTVVRKAAAAAGTALVEVNAAILEKISNRDNPQSVIGVFRQKIRSLSELDPLRAPLWLALEGVRDPGNFGTCVRTADAVGAGGVILIGTTCDPFSPEAVRATMGSIFAVPVFAASTQEAVDLLARWPGTSVGTALQGAEDYRQVKFRAPTIIVNGTEQSGLTQEMRDACGKLAKLPMRGRADSLNLSVAASVMLYAALDRLLPDG
ncbi:MAG: RNA methyltransferase [Rhodospirillales bacterium]|nr:RNA methyltransferase [Rhodospirillales bacterium]